MIERVKAGLVVGQEIMALEQKLAIACEALEDIKKSSNGIGNCGYQHILADEALTKLKSK